MEFRSFTDGCKDSRKHVIQSSQVPVLLSCGILRRLKGKETIHFNADASNTELLFRIIQSVNQLCVYGPVADWCEQFGLTADGREQEKILANGESADKQKLKSDDSQEVRSNTSQLTKFCERASFRHTVELV